ncbi:hypothetical protein ACQPZG_31635 [Streptomyces sp. CA-294286]|uniref:hypothetical protein n=1 Tax=Streptomyces sp. CA-294286 TaxID=3240070 RepID=UPI003D8BFC46
MSSPVDPHAIRAATETVGGVIRELEDGVLPERATVLLAQVFDPDVGLLSRLSALLDSTAHYTQRHGARPEVHRTFGDAAEDLLARSEDLGEAVQRLGQLRTAAPPYAAPGLPPAPASRAPSVRR